MNPIDLSIIIVNYNTKALTMECIDSVMHTVQDVTYEIILVDNSTQQEERITLENALIKCFRIPNRGYANANNFGMEQATGAYILLLNPDTIVYEHTISECLSYLKSHPLIGAIGCKILRPDGSLDLACRRGFPTPFNSFCYFAKLHKLFKHNPKFCQYTFSHLDDSISCEVDSLTGAFMMIPRIVLEKVGILDETFFMYGEDIDLCYRIKSADYQIYYYADFSILHKKYQSGIAKSSPLVIKHFYRSMTLFYNKHYKVKYPFFVTWLVHLGVNCLTGIKLICNRLKKQ